MTSSRQDGVQNCRIRLNEILAIIVRKEGCQRDPGDFWMYENGYLLFQGLLSSNSVCWWNNALNGATQNLVYYGYVNPGALLVGAETCALEVLRNAWARRVLQPPPGYQIIAVEDIEYCSATPVAQTQWTPLPEAVCAVVLKLSSQGRPAGIETIREALILTFPHVSPPGEQAIYDTLVQLTKERKLYNTSNGYYIVTPEKKRSRSQSRTKRDPDALGKTMLMSTEEAMAMVHGDMATLRDGNVTHQCIQTNLADVICGGNASDKILYPRTKRRSSSFPAPRSPDRRGSFRLWNSNRRLRRSASTRTIHKQQHYVDTSSSTEYPNSGDSTPTPRKESLLSRLFRRSKRSQCHIATFGGQFPPTEWFNTKTVHLHSVGTQTCNEKDTGLDIEAYLETSCRVSSRSSSLPRRHKRHPSLDSSPLSTLPRKPGVRSRDRSRGRPPNAEHIYESLKASQRYEEPAASIDNSGPSSIESHKGGSATSGPSSLESHKTVIDAKEHQQFTVQNSPTVRSVITFDNGQEEKPNLVIVNGGNETKEDPKSTKNTNQDTMNNRKMSLQLPTRDGLNFHNLIKNVESSTKNSYPSSPTKSYDGLGMYLKNDKNNAIGSEPNICCKEREQKQEFPSIGDLSFNFTSLAAQKILRGVSINSVDTLVELSMAAGAEKQNNCDVVHTDFGMF
ncbi:storkhead-box protein 2 isoform X2 [Cylas formicarius]|uniref:storkhead-box protein 2 isoform X2 n=1 Tax=Cylas formicarius TaxID=197179 RepID=UPI0029587FA9|nr:storkhead-box protein 2 isoform X2 [Cylas formicarius]